MAKVSTAGKTSELQRVYVYCKDAEEARRIHSVCLETRTHHCEPRDATLISAQAVADALDHEDEDPTFKGADLALRSTMLKMRFGMLPKPYLAEHSWEEFAEDVHILLEASLAEAAQREQDLSTTTLKTPAAFTAALAGGKGRNPPLLVTDQRRLYNFACNDTLREALAEAFGREVIKVEQILSVVLAKDFSMLHGESWHKPAESVFRSRVLEGAPAAIEQSRTAALTKLPTLEVGPGVYIQRCRIGAKAAELTAPPAQDPILSSGGALSEEDLANAERQTSERRGSQAAERRDSQAAGKRGSAASALPEDAAAAEVAAGGRGSAIGSHPSSSQRPSQLSQASDDPTAARGGRPAEPMVDHLYGARFLVLLRNGRCAYSAVAPNGRGVVEAGGSWEVINGRVVLGGFAGKDATTRRLVVDASDALVAADAEQQLAGTFMETDLHSDKTVQVSLDDLQQLFDSPLPELSLCASLVDRELYADYKKIVRRCNELCKAEAPIESSLMSDQQVSVLTPRPKQTSRQLPPVGAIQWPQSARGTGSLWRSTPNALPTIKGNLVLGAGGGSTSSSAGGCTTKWRRTARSLAGASHGACPLKPGTYSFEAGAHGSADFRSLALELRGDGTYAYNEACGSSTVRVEHEHPTWHVEGNTLVLSYKCRCRRSLLEETESRAQRPGAAGDCVCGEQGFEQVVHRGEGFRKLRTKLGRVEMRVKDLLEKCTYAPASDIVEPFPATVSDVPEADMNDVANHAEQRMQLLGGLEVEVLRAGGFMRTPSQPVAVGKDTRLRLPGETGGDSGPRPQGSVWELAFLEEEADGSLTWQQVEACEKAYYAQTREAEDPLPLKLRSRYLASLARALDSVFGGDFDAAFDAAQAKAPLLGEESGQEGRIPVQAFRQFLEAESQEQRGSELASWLSSIPEDTLESLLRQICRQSGGSGGNLAGLSREGLQGLRLHEGVAAVFQLEHFRRWLVEAFGDSKEGFDLAFSLLDTAGHGSMTETEFCKALLQLGYPCTDSDVRMLFAMLDVKFKGSISAESLQVAARTFKSTTFFEQLDALKAFVTTKGGGARECWKSLVQQEAVRRSRQADSPSKVDASGMDISHVAFETLQGVLPAKLAREVLLDTPLRHICIFLALSTRQPQAAAGRLSASAITLAAAFDRRSLEGTPAALFRFLASEYGSVEQAFETLLEMCSARALGARLERQAFAGLLRAFRLSGAMGPIGAEALALPTRRGGQTTQMLSSQGMESLSSSCAGEREQRPWRRDSDSNSMSQTIHARAEVTWQARCSPPTARPADVWSPEHSVTQSGTGFATSLSSKSPRVRATNMVSQLAPVALETLQLDHWSSPKRRGGTVRGGSAEVAAFEEAAASSFRRPKGSVQMTFTRPPVPRHRLGCGASTAISWAEA
eukprot:TRINITY_DN14482_c0_g1_i5.p1 TRINITY_DN14482_c0_g1~~TRINITY_DN14482_c0_g1_i5.p1  ORF type:complete len:1403 (-),score=313.70 TRINITY_DN14482_c0_g1_i5:61-4269(-)